MFYILAADNKKQINSIIKTSPNITILFHWNMCGYCAALKPTWDKVCKKYHNDNNCHILNVEVGQLNNLGKKYRDGVNGYPTITKYKHGKNIAEYNDERTLKNLNKFVKS